MPATTRPAVAAPPAMVPSERMATTPRATAAMVAARAIATANRSAAAPTDGDAGVSEAGGCLDIE